jgi:hypothetical protein
MATFLNVNDIVKVQVVCTRGVQTALNTGHFTVFSIVGGGLTDTQVALAFDNLFSPGYRAWLTSIATYLGALVQKIFPLPPSSYKFSRANTHAGNAGNLPLPGEVSGLVACQTNFAGKAFRGRLYLPWPDQAYVTADMLALTAGGQALMGAIAADWFTPVTFTVGGASTTLSPAIFHKKANKAGTTAPNTTTPIISDSIEVLLADQRKRAARGRPNPPPV